LVFKTNQNAQITCIATDVLGIEERIPLSSNEIVNNSTNGPREKEEVRQGIGRKSGQTETENPKTENQRELSDYRKDALWVKFKLLPRIRMNSVAAAL
jgi:hypothetical protein